MYTSVFSEVIPVIYRLRVLHTALKTYCQAESFPVSKRLFWLGTATLVTKIDRNRCSNLFSFDITHSSKLVQRCLRAPRSLVQSIALAALALATETRSLATTTALVNLDNEDTALNGVDENVARGEQEV
jgi:hypothetical protein